MKMEHFLGEENTPLYHHMENSIITPNKFTPENETLQ
jgi:hypothetical protein